MEYFIKDLMSEWISITINPNTPEDVDKSILEELEEKQNIDTRFITLEKETDHEYSMRDNGIASFLERNDISKEDFFREDAIWTYSVKGNLEAVELLLRNNVSCNITKIRSSNLVVACINGHIEIVELLLKYGATHCPDEEGDTPLFKSAFSGRLDIVKLLLENGATQDPNKDG